MPRLLKISALEMWNKKFYSGFPKKADVCGLFFTPKCIQQQKTKNPSWNWKHNYCHSFGSSNKISNSVSPIVVVVFLWHVGWAFIWIIVHQIQQTLHWHHSSHPIKLLQPHRICTCKYFITEIQQNLYFHRIKSDTWDALMAINYSTLQKCVLVIENEQF